MKLLICIVPHGKSERITLAARKAGATGGTVLMGRGTAKNQILEMLGLGDTRKDLIYMLLDDELYAAVRAAVLQEAAKEKSGFGIVFTIDVEKFLKNSSINIQKEDSMAEATHTLISIIVNDGFADDAMAAARKAGAGGGTIINARGTGREDDAKFFGITIVPEKEMLLILAEKSKADAILDAVRSLPCLQTKGTGITYCIDVNDFAPLGTPKK